MELKLLSQVKDNRTGMSVFKAKLCIMFLKYSRWGIMLFSGIGEIKPLKNQEWSLLSKSQLISNPSRFQTYVNRIDFKC